MKLHLIKPTSVATRHRVQLHSSSFAPQYPRKACLHAQQSRQQAVAEWAGAVGARHYRPAAAGRCGAAASSGAQDSCLPDSPARSPGKPTHAIGTSPGCRSRCHSCLIPCIPGCRMVPNDRALWVVRRSGRRSCKWHCIAACCAPSRLSRIPR